MSIDELCLIVCDFYKAGSRAMPWRESQADGTYDPYKILVSELMLQQTQVARVIPKFKAFIGAFPTVFALADASLSDVLTLWSGLGYNRRARFLHKSAKTICSEYGGIIPNDQEKLEALHGVGKNTAAAVRAYAFNEAVTFIETNIRSVFLHHLFSDRVDVTDAQLLPKVEEALFAKTNSLDPRQWYWALMDYGVYLKDVHSNPSRRSKHHTTQSKFKGSRREVRGAVLKLLSSHPQSREKLAGSVPTPDYLDTVLESLANECLITQVGDMYYLGDAILKR